MYNLLQEQWIPATRKSRKTPAYISPSQITEDSATNPVIALSAPRPDFNGALLQFLIGLVQTSCPPADASDWQKKFMSPPAPEYLNAAFGRYADAFNLDGDGPRFMQDLDLAETEGEWNSIDHLLIEMPGNQTLTKNTDIFQKRGTIRNLCPSCCAMALFTLQTNAPAGGRGHRTSLRGGGPLTTLVMGRTLWESIWLNVITTDALSHFGNAGKTGKADMFPWLGCTRTSGNNESITPQDVHPVQMFWGMPRRVRLIFEVQTEVVSCDLCGRRGHTVAARYSDTSYGLNYKSGWHHILTPYTTDSKTGASFPLHGQPGGISYRDRLGLIQERPGKNVKTEPAVVVQAFREERESALPKRPGFPFQLFAFGYDMDNMKARGWYEGRLPLVHANNEIRSAYDAVVSQMINTADQIAFTVRLSLKKALFASESEVSGDLSVIDYEFWQDTEPHFSTLLGELCENLKNKHSVTAMKLHWLSFLTREGEMLFDRYSQSNMISVANPKRIALARNDFTQFSSPHNKKIIELLDLPKTLDKGHKNTGASIIEMHRTLEPEPDLSFSRPELREILISWWKELDSWGGDRAALRQCRTPRDVALTPAFQRLKIRLTSYGSLNQGQMDRLALVAGVLSHVKGNKPDAFEKNVKRSCAVQMAHPPQKSGRGTNSCVSDLRFRQLLKIEEPDTLYMTMISLVRLLRGSVDIASLAHGISRWNEQTKKEWAYAYYENESREEKQGG